MLHRECFEAYVTPVPCAQVKIKSYKTTKIQYKLQQEWQILQFDLTLCNLCMQVCTVV